MVKYLKHVGNFHVEHLRKEKGKISGTKVAAVRTQISLLEKNSRKQSVDSNFKFFPGALQPRGDRDNLISQYFCVKRQVSISILDGIENA